MTIRETLAREKTNMITVSEYLPGGIHLPERTENICAPLLVTQDLNENATRQNTGIDHKIKFSERRPK